jgi:hypothetical protein
MLEHNINQLRNYIRNISESIWGTVVSAYRKPIKKKKNISENYASAYQKPNQRENNASTFLKQRNAST